jgi:hypothetical protein
VSSVIDLADRGGIVLELTTNADFEGLGGGAIFGIMEFYHL